MALALATSVASSTMRVISSGATIGLLAKPHTPLWITRTPKPNVSSSPNCPNPMLPALAIWPLRTATPFERLNVKRMSA